MKEAKLFYQDIMTQNFSVGTFYNPTRYMILYAMLNLGNFKRQYQISSIADLVFNAYVDNPIIAVRHPKIEIQKSPKFGSNVMIGEIYAALYEWTHDAYNGVLTYDLNNIYLDIDEDNLISDYVKKILQVLFEKNFKCQFKGIDDMREIVRMNDTDLMQFGQSVFKFRVMADMQYCVLCDDVDINDLYAVHILETKYCDGEAEKIDKNNGLLMCKKHAEEYNQGKFCFNERGKVINISSVENMEGMRLSNIVLLPRKNYLKRKLLLKKN